MAFYSLAQFGVEYLENLVPKRRTWVWVGQHRKGVGSCAESLHVLSRFRPQKGDLPAFEDLGSHSLKVRWMQAEEGG